MEGREAETEKTTMKNWSEKVEDLIEAGDTDAAISLLESLISHLETLISPDSQSQLASALLELSRLYSSKGLSLKCDQLSSRASAVKLRPLSSTTQVSVENDNSRVSSVDTLRDSGVSSSIKDNEVTQSLNDNVARQASSDDDWEAMVDRAPDELLAEYSSQASVKKDESRFSSVDSSCGGGSSSIKDEGNVESIMRSWNDNVQQQASSDDDWEAMVDRAPDELLSVSSQSIPEVSKLSLRDTKVKIPNMRGRGTFTYRKQGLYSDQQDDEDVGYESPDEGVHDKAEKVPEKRKLYGTQHVLVLEGFHQSTTTTDLEKLFEDFRDRVFAIRWVHDTLALAVFRTPAIAREAFVSIRCSFPVRVLEEDDSVMPSVSVKDLDPPRRRPKTSARTAQRLIAQELGVKLPSNFGSRELRKQEDARKSRIVARQTLRDEAWGPDDE